MVQPFDVYLGLELAPSRKAAIEAVRASGCDDDESAFWDRVTRIEDICNRYEIEPTRAASALDLITPFMDLDGEYGNEAIFEYKINGLIAAIARRLPK